MNTLTLDIETQNNLFETTQITFNNKLKKSNTPYYEFEKIKNHFDSLNMDLNHFQNSNDICTPMDCVKTMIDSIPADFWKKKDLKIFDSCCGNGNFHAYILTKTLKKNLFFNEINVKRIENLISYFGKDIELTIRDFLSFPEKEVYDLVVSNPPYAKFNQGVRVSKNHNLARDFIHKALKIVKPNGYILFIVPNNWMSFSDRNILPKLLSNFQFIKLDIHGAKKWFPKVGSSFTWFLLKKSPNKLPFEISNHYIIHDIQKTTLRKNSTFIPLYYSEIVKKILEKTIYDDSLPKYKIETNSYLHRYTKQDLIKNEQDTNFKYRLIHTPSQTVWSKIPHKFQGGYKLFISLSNQYKTFIDDCGMTQSIAYIKCHSKHEAENLKTELDNDVYIFLNNLTRYGNFNNIRILQKFPLLNTYILNTEEVNFIKYFNNQYYGKEEKE